MLVQYNLLDKSQLLQDSRYVINSELRKRMSQKIINSDVFHFHFEVELNNYKYDFLIEDHKPLRDGRIDPIKMTLEIHNAEIIMKKDNSGYL